MAGAPTTTRCSADGYYEVHLRPWCPGCSELADELIDYVIDLGFTDVELLPVIEHPIGRQWGYQVTWFYAPTSRLGTPDEFRVPRRHAVTRPASACSWTGCRRTSQGRVGAGRFDGTALYEHSGSRTAASTRTGAALCSTSVATRCGTSWSANALDRWQEFHVDVFGVDAVASMLYLDYSRPSWAAGTPNVYGGRENLEAVQFLQGAERPRDRHPPGVVMIAEESTSWPGVTSRSNRARAALVWPEVEHGLDERHAPVFHQGAMIHRRSYHHDTR